MQTIIAFAAAALISLGGCSSSEPKEPPLVADCAHRTGCIQIAFTNFRGEEAELFLNGDSVFRGVLQTANWSTASSGSAEFDTDRLRHARLVIDGRAVFDQAITARDVRTIYVEPRAPYVELTNHPGPLLD